MFHSARKVDDGENCDDSTDSLDDGDGGLAVLPGWGEWAGGRVEDFEGNKGDDAGWYELHYPDIEGLEGVIVRFSINN